MTAYKPSNFDQGFRSGKGWGGLSVRARSDPSTMRSRLVFFRVGFREESVVRRDARAFDDGIARLAVKINRHL